VWKKFDFRFSVVRRRQSKPSLSCRRRETNVAIYVRALHNSQPTRRPKSTALFVFQRTRSVASDGKHRHAYYGTRPPLFPRLMNCWFCARGTLNMHVRVGHRRPRPTGVLIKSSRRSNVTLSRFLCMSIPSFCLSRRLRNVAPFRIAFRYFRPCLMSDSAPVDNHTVRLISP